MWLYTSYAVQPHRSVASKNGDFRYHGPKYKVLDVTSGVALASPLTAHPPSTGGLPAPRGPRTPAQLFVPAHPSTESSFNSIHRARRTGKSTPGCRAELPSADPFEIVLVEGDESVRIEGDVGLEAAGAVAHHPVAQRLVPLPGWFCGQFRDPHEAHGVLPRGRAFVEEPVAGDGQGVEERRMLQVEEVRVAELNPDAGAAVQCEFQHRSVERPAQLVGDPDLRALGTIKALGAHDLHPWLVEPAPHQRPYRHDHSVGPSRPAAGALGGRVPELAAYGPEVTSAPWQAPDPPLALAEQQFHWYARNRNLSRVRYHASEVLILLTAAATTLAAALGADALITASCQAFRNVLLTATLPSRIR